MSDLLYLAVLIGFFALCSGLVTLCDRIVGHDDPVASTPVPEPGATGPAAEVAS